MDAFLIGALTRFGTAFGLDLLGYFFTAGLFALLVFKLRPARLMARKIQPERHATKDDMRREIKASVRTGAIFGLVGIVGYALSQFGLMRFYTDISQYGIAYFIVSAMLVIIAHDAWFYWTHRMMHHPKLLKHMHVTHHRSRVPTPFTAFSFDPLEALSHALFTTIFVMLVPVHPIVMTFHFIFMIIRNVMGHTGFELMPKWWLNSRWTSWINTTTHHDLHHQRGGYNLGLYFTWWDKLMGTEHPDYMARFHEVWQRSDAVEADQKEAQSGRLAGRLVAGMVGLFVGVAMLLATGVSRADQSADNAFAGHWVSSARDIVLEIAPCDTDHNGWCGTIVWVPTNNDGSDRLDLKNKNKKNKTRPLAGILMGWGFEKAGANHYTGGKVYSPDDGNIYKGKVRIISEEALELDGCVFVFCRTEHLDRYKPGMKLLNPATNELVAVDLPLGRQYAAE